MELLEGVRSSWKEGERTSSFTIGGNRSTRETKDLRTNLDREDFVCRQITFSRANESALLHCVVRKLEVDVGGGKITFCLFRTTLSLQHYTLLPTLHITIIPLGNHELALNFTWILTWYFPWLRLSWFSHMALELGNFPRNWARERPYFGERGEIYLSRELRPWNCWAMDIYTVLTGR